MSMSAIAKALNLSVSRVSRLIARYEGDRAGRQERCADRVDAATRGQKA